MLAMDMVHHNPGEAMTESKGFLIASFLKASEYGAKVFFLFEAAQFGIDWKSLILLYFRILLKPGAGFGRESRNNPLKNMMRQKRKVFRYVACLIC